jgi:hypothetical protein
VEDCYTDGYAEGEVWVGGIAGLVNGNIVRSYSSATVVVNSNIGGGLMGELRGDATDCYATGTVSGNMRVGGFVGQDDTPGTTTITNCYASGPVSSATSYGGFISDPFGTYVDCFWDMDTSGAALGSATFTPPGVTGLTTAQAMTQATFNPPWDFTNDWWMVDGETRPFLQIMGHHRKESSPASVDVNRPHRQLCTSQ